MDVRYHFFPPNWLQCVYSLLVRTDTKWIYQGYLKNKLSEYCEQDTNDDSPMCLTAEVEHLWQTYLLFVCFLGGAVEVSVVGIGILRKYLHILN